MKCARLLIEGLLRALTLSLLISAIEEHFGEQQHPLCTSSLPGPCLLRSFFPFQIFPCLFFSPFPAPFPGQKLRATPRTIFFESLFIRNPVIPHQNGV